MLEGNLQAVRGDQFFHGVSSLLHRSASLRQSPIKEGHFLANSIFELGIREPRNVVKIGRDSRRLLNVISDDDSRLSLKIVADLREKAALHEFVSRGLQIGAAHLRT